MTICPHRLGQEAVIYGLGRLDDWHGCQQGNHEPARGNVRRGDAREPLRGGFCRHLFDEQSVPALAGEMFGPYQNRYLRLSGS